MRSQSITAKLLPFCAFCLVFRYDFLPVSARSKFRIGHHFPDKRGGRAPISVYRKLGATCRKTDQAIGKIERRAGPRSNTGEQALRSTSRGVPRSVCQGCVVGMDHHCPFVRNCVGTDNMRHFILFVFWTIVSCAYVASQVGSLHP